MLAGKRKRPVRLRRAPIGVFNKKMCIRDRVDVQEGRVVLEGTAHCQAVYRQGGEASLRSLTAQAQLRCV